MKSTLRVDVNAPPAIVFALARDVTRWADLLPHYARSRAVSRNADGTLLVEFVARRAIRGIPGVGLLVAWRAVTWSEPESYRLRFAHRGGATDGMDVTWRIQPHPAGTGSRVTIEHAFAAPMVWASFIDRYFTRAIAGRTLASFRAIAEAVATSSGAVPTNQET